MIVVTLSYDGCGWAFPYLAGVTKRVQELQENEIVKRHVLFKYSGISSGACVALAAALDVDMEELMMDALDWSRWCRLCPWLTCYAVIKIAKNCIDDVFDIKQFNEKKGFALGVLERRFLKLKPTVISKFKSMDELQKMVCYGCSIPMVNAIPMSLRYFDIGCCMRFLNIPWTTDLHFKISPWHQNKYANCRPKHSLISKWNAFIPLHKQKLVDLYHQGYEDGYHICTEIMKHI